MAADPAAAGRAEEDQLRMKFRSLTFTAPKREQKLHSVTADAKQHAADQSYKLWKRVNPGFFEDELTTSTRECQKYNLSDYQDLNKERFRLKDRHTEYVEYAVRDKALARKSNK
jgi:hypothetical protein